MRYLILSFLLTSLPLYAQDLEEDEDLQAQAPRTISPVLTESSLDDKESAEKMLKTLKRGQDFQMRQQKALEELDSEQ